MKGSTFQPRLAIEFRHPSWNRYDVMTRIAEFGLGMVIHDMGHAGGWRVENHTLKAGELTLERDRIDTGLLPFLYLRFHGTTGRYAGEYGDQRLRPWAATANYAIRQGRPAFAYFQ